MAPPGLENLAAPSDPAPSGGVPERLPMRTDVVVGLPGRRVTRSEVELGKKDVGIGGDDKSDDARSDMEESEGSGDSDESSMEVDFASEDGSASSVDGKTEAVPDDGDHVGDEDSDDEVEEEAEEEARAVARLREADEEELRNANAAAEQKNLYDAAVDFRIRLEPVLDLARRMPMPAEEGDGTPQVDEAAETACAALDKIAAAFDDFAKQFSDERDDHDLESDVAWQNTTLNDWVANSRLAGNMERSFKAIDTRPSSQLAQVLEGGKHLQRARKIPSPVELFDGSELTGSHRLAYNDAELYRTLLRDVIESGDAAGGGLKHAELARNGRVRKKIDRRASKGRKLRYVVHEKLVGFLAPEPMPHPGPVDELVAGLFGASKR